MIDLSILDQAPVSKGNGPHETLRRSAELARLSEGWGYKRYWFAEHHGTRGLASVSPEDRKQIEENRKRMVIGSPAAVKRRLLELSARYQTKEMMVLCNVFDFEAKKESYERLADIFL
ncbi:hypothetical protein [Bacillus velezensis]|nr:hypothetical protein [Bacillus velezensis]MEC2354157.1 hypothetical protein [Bacillus velezensis]MED3402167.1 hypothetical protein [Bacillus velezensis]